MMFTGRFLWLGLVAALAACSSSGTVPLPTVSGVLPSSGPAAGGTVVTVRGQFFEIGDTIGVTFGGNDATSVVVVADDELTCVTPAGTAGTAADIVVTTVAGSGTLENGFTYLAPPTVTSVMPVMGFNAGGTPVTIAGSGFTQGGTAVVSFGTSIASLVTVVNDTTIQATTPASPQRGPVAVRVGNDRGEGVAPGAFTYVNYPPILDPLGDLQIDDDDLLHLGDDPEMAASGDHVYVAWMENRDNEGFDVYFNRSLDGGETWENTNRQLNVESGVYEERFGVRMCADDDNVYVTWVDGRNDNQLEVYFNRSQDAGATWLPNDVRIFHTDPGSAAQQFWHSVACDGDRVVVVWPDNRSMDSALFANASGDGGDTWLSEDVPVSSAGIDIAPHSSLCVEGNSVYLAWSDSRNGDGDIFFNRSSDGGATWLASEVRIDNGPADTWASDPTIACSGANVYVAWPDDRDEQAGSTDVYMVASTNGGLTFGSTDRRVNTDPAGTGSIYMDSDRPPLLLAASEATVHVGWLDTRNGPPEPFYNRSTDAGQSFGAADIRLNPAQDAGTVDVYAMAMCAAGEAVHAVFLQGGEVCLNASANGGASFLDEEVRVNGDMEGEPPGFAAGLGCNGPIAYVVWRDDRNLPCTGEIDSPPCGPTDVFFRRNVP